MWQVAQGWAAAAAPRSAYTPKEQTVQAKRRATRHGHVGAKTTVHDDETEDGGPRLEVGRGSALLPPDEPMTVDAGESYDRKLEDLREEAVLHKARHVMAKKARGEELSSVDQDYFIMVAGENGLTRMRYKQLMGGAKLPPLSDITYEDIRGDTLGKAQGKKMYGKRQRNALEYCKNHKNGVFVAPKGRMTQKAEAKRARLAEAGDVKSLMKLLSAREEEAGMERRPGSLANELSNFETYRSFAMQMGRSPYMFDLASGADRGLGWLHEAVRALRLTTLRVAPGLAEHGFGGAHGQHASGGRGAALFPAHDGRNQGSADDHVQRGGREA
jgi:hypothetical protein